MGGHKLVQILQSAVADPGERPGGPAAPPPLFLEQTEAGRAEKKILETGQNGRPKLFFCLYLVKRLIVTLRCAVNVTTSSFQHFP